MKKKIVAAAAATAVVVPAAAKASGTVGATAAVAGSAARDWLLLLLAGLGVSFAPHEYIGGLFLAMAGAALSFHVDKRVDKTTFRPWAVYMAAFVVSTTAAVIYDGFMPDYSKQVIMLLAGFSSRFIILAVSNGLAFWERTAPEKIARRIDSHLGLDTPPRDTPPQPPEDGND